MRLIKKITIPATINETIKASIVPISNKSREISSHHKILLMVFIMSVNISDRTTDTHTKCHSFTCSSQLINLIINLQNLDISLKVNGKLKQDSNTSFMIFSIEEIIEFISKVMTLEPGDLILTGTPEGVDEIKKGDILEAKLGNICSLKVFVD